MCIRDSVVDNIEFVKGASHKIFGQIPTDVDGVLEAQFIDCLLYTSDADDERSSVDLGGRRIIKKKKHIKKKNRNNRKKPK